MESQCFDLRLEGKIAELILKRPQALNTMIPEFWRELPAIVHALDDAATARVLLIASTGKHFCAGMDLSVFAAGLGPEGQDPFVRAEAFRHQVKALQNTFSAVAHSRIPTIAAVQGGCIGAGVDFVTACDIRYATADAFFQIAEINIAMTADVGTFPRLCKLIPDGWVRELAYTGRRLPAAKAKEIGLVNEVFASQDEMLIAARETAREIAARNPLAVTGSKVMIQYARDHSEADALDYIATWQTAMLAPPHMAEAFAAQAQKRAPIFPDLAPIPKGL